VGTSAGLTLLEPPSAKASALGGAFSAASNDIAAFGYNPSSLMSLSNPSASFMYEKGVIDDAYGHFLLGTPSNGRRALGLSIGYYDSGTIDVYDGLTSHAVTAQTDLVIGVGGAMQRGPISFGLTGKVIRSQLIETHTAQAYAVDLGAGLDLPSGSRIGVSFQNFGTDLKYKNEGDPLPRIARVGYSYPLFSGAYPTHLLLDVPYYLNEAETTPSLGLETWVGPLAIRGGYTKGFDENNFAIGTGFILGKSSLDYSFDFKNDLDVRHRVSFSMKFDNPSADANLFARKVAPKPEPVQVVEAPAPVVEAPAPVAEAPAPQPEPERVAMLIQPEEKPVPMTPIDQFIQENKKEEPVVVEAQKEEEPIHNKTGKRRVYIIKEGDTLEKIAFEFYGDREEWKNIFVANRHLMEHRRDIQPGKKIVLP
jgi:hypothetical protein